MSDKSSAAGSLSCCGYSCEQSFSMDLSSKPQPSSSWGFSLRSGLQGGFWDKIRGRLREASPQWGAPKASAPRSLAPKGLWAPLQGARRPIGRTEEGGKENPFPNKAESEPTIGKRVVVPPLRNLIIGIEPILPPDFSL